MKRIRLFALVALAATLPALRAADDQKLKPYALETCFISGEKLGEMGKPVVTAYAGQELKFCCRDCKKTFDKDPAAGLKKYETALKSKGSTDEHSHTH